MIWIYQQISLTFSPTQVSVIHCRPSVIRPPRTEPPSPGFYKTLNTDPPSPGFYKTLNTDPQSPGFYKTLNSDPQSPGFYKTLNTDPKSPRFYKTLKTDPSSPDFYKPPMTDPSSPGYSSYSPHKDNMQVITFFLSLPSCSSSNEKIRWEKKKWYIKEHFFLFLLNINWTTLLLICVFKINIHKTGAISFTLLGGSRVSPIQNFNQSEMFFFFLQK